MKPRVLVNALSLSEGGGRSYVINLLRELGRDDRGFDFTLLVPRGQLDGADAHGVAVREPNLPSLPTRALWRIGYEELVLPFAAGRHDLLYCIADLAPRRARAPTVVLLRNLNIYDRRWYDDARTRTLERLVRFGLPHAERVLFPSRAAADLIGPLVGVREDRVRIVPYGVSLDAFDRQATREPASVPYLFLPAAVEKHKNIEVVIDGLARTADRSLELWIAGHSPADPGHRETLRRRADALGIAARVRFLGPVPYRELFHYYREAAGFAFPSFIETFGHPLLEAMAIGSPALVSDIPAFREIAQDAALYFAPDDPAGVARAIDAIRSDPEATRRRVEIGRARAQQYSWRASIDALCAVFGEVLRDGRSAAPASREISSR